MGAGPGHAHIEHVTGQREREPLLERSLNEIKKDDAASLEFHGIIYSFWYPWKICADRVDPDRSCKLPWPKVRGTPLNLGRGTTLCTICRVLARCGNNLFVCLYNTDKWKNWHILIETWAVAICQKEPDWDNLQFWSQIKFMRAIDKATPIYSSHTSVSGSLSTCFLWFPLFSTSSVV